MVWASQIIGDDYDANTDEEDADRKWVISQLIQHPLFKSGQIAEPSFGDNPATPSSGAGELDPKNPPVKDPKEEEKKRREMQTTQQEQMVLAGEIPHGWFEDVFGKNPNDIVKDLRRKRREHKQYREDIDDAIKMIRITKEMEVDNTLQKLSWSGDHLGTIKSLGLSDRDLKALSRFGENREVSLRQSCMQWERADKMLTKLASIDDLNTDQQRLWVDAINLKKEAKKMWRHTLHQSEQLSKRDAMFLHKSKELLDMEGPMDSRSLHTHMTDGDGRSRGVPSVQQLGALLKVYGPEFDITKNKSNWESLSTDTDVILKNPWAYAAGFLDADGYITISKRGEPRAGIIATGERGKIHCENMHKILDCGVLSLDLKIGEVSKRSQHRLQFYSKADLNKLLKGVLPHLRMKKEQARYVLQHLNLRGRNNDIISKRREELYRLVKWENWKDVKSEELLEEWNVDEGDVISWGRQDPEVIRLIDDASALLGAS